MTKRRKTIQRDPMGQLLSSYEEEEEDTEDSISTIIPGGGKVRVSLTMMRFAAKSGGQGRAHQQVAGRRRHRQHPEPAQARVPHQHRRFPPA